MAAVTVLWWLLLVLLVVVDAIMRWQRKKLSGRRLTLWIVAVIVVPFAGTVAYLALRVYGLLASPRASNGL
jgi:hypothetical protein